jgi:signal transduction histidine kinase
MALEHGRMQAELHGQLVELRRSRVRLIAAIDTERRRIERNLHDGVQARLVALGLALRSRQRATRGPRDPDGEAAIDEAIHGIQEILGQVRGFAQGVMSPMLISEGLPGAVRELADQIRTPVSTHVHVVRRPPDHVESTAWYVTCEGITNALKHAPGSPIRVWIDADADQLTVQVVDDGPGGADPELGTGLAGLQDRVEAVGGSLHVISPLGGGTVLRALLPCAS